MKSIKQVQDDLGKGRFTPENLKGKEYRALVQGETVTIIGCTMSIYQAREKEDYEPMFREDGTPVMNTTGYLELDDGTVASVKGRVAIEQLWSCTDMEIPEAVGQYPIADWEPVKVKISSVEQKFGEKVYPVVAFEPVE